MTDNSTLYHPLTLFPDTQHSIIGSVIAQLLLYFKLPLLLYFCSPAATQFLGYTAVAVLLSRRCYNVVARLLHHCHQLWGNVGLVLYSPPAGNGIDAATRVVSCWKVPSSSPSGWLTLKGYFKRGYATGRG